SSTRPALGSSTPRTSGAVGRTGRQAWSSIGPMGPTSSGAPIRATSRRRRARSGPLRPVRATPSSPRSADRASSSLTRLRSVPVEIDIDHVARLARLDLSDDEKVRLREQLGVILEAAARVQEVAAEDVPPTSYAIPRSN